MLQDLILTSCYLILIKLYTPILLFFRIKRRRYYNYSLKILSIRPLCTRSFTTIELRLKGKAPLLPPTIRPMALAY